MQLTYTIRQSDLKPVYREAGLQLVKTKCEELESELYGLETSIGVEWRPEAVEFNIAGLEEGVATALRLVKQEFQVLCD